MNKKGFTLVELIAIILVLSIILTVVFISLTGSIENTKESEYKNFILNLEMAAETYVNLPGIYKDIDEKIKNGEHVQISVYDLISKGIIDEIPTNPKTDGEFTNYISVTKNSNNEFVFTVQE